MQFRADDEDLDCVLAERLSGLQTMDASCQNVTPFTFSNHDRLFLAFL